MDGAFSVGSVTTTLDFRQDTREATEYERKREKLRREAATPITQDVKVDADTRGLSAYERKVRDVDRGHGDLVRGTGRVRGAFGSLFFGGAGVAAGAVAVGGLAMGVKSVVGAFQESQQVGRQTEQVIRSTGGAARISAKEVGDLATQISNRTGIDDEAIQSGANMLLTFTNVRNEAGKGNDVFNQSTRILTDMSAALGQDMSNSAIQLGKALNDPIRGVSALSRVGVSFTDQQKEQIRALVEGGRTAEAQKIILHELSKEFGGSAEATATNTRRMQVAFGNLEESIGGALAPTVEKAAGGLSKFVNGLTSGTGAGGKFVKTARDIGSAITGGAGAAFRWVGGVIDENRASLDSVFDSVKRVGDVFIDVGGSVIHTIKEAFGEGGGGRDIRDFIHGLLNIVAAGARVVAWLVEKMAPGIKKQLEGFVQVIRGIVKVLAGLMTLDFGRMWDGVKMIFGGAIKVLLGMVQRMTAPMLAILSKLGGFVVDALAPPFNFVKGVVERFLDTYLGVVTGVMLGLEKMADAASHLPFIGGKFKGLADKIRGAREDIDGFRESLRDQDRDARRTDGIDKQRQAVDRLRTRIGTLRRGTAEYADAVDELRKRQRRLNDTLADVHAQRRAARAFVTLAGNVAGFGGVALEVMRTTGANVNEVLGAFGARALRYAIKNPRKAGAAAGEFLGGAVSLAGAVFAGGGFVGGRGERGRDDQHLVVPAGGAFANAHQLPAIEAALAAHGLGYGDVWGGPGGGGGGPMQHVIAGRGEAYFAPDELPGIDALMRSAYGGFGLDDLFAATAHTRHAFAAGGVVPAVARLGDLLTRRFGLVVTSTTGGGHADGSYHYQGKAEDISGSSGAMAAASSWLLSSGTYRSLLEGIHNPGLSVKNGAIVDPSFWGGETWADHGDHIHVALDDLGPIGAMIARLLITGPRGPMRDGLQAISDRVNRAANSYVGRNTGSMVGPDSGGPAGFFSGSVRGKVSTFGPPTEGAGPTAGGGSSAEPGLALNMNPGTDSGWNNSTTDAWAKSRKPFRVNIAGRSGILPVIDKGPAGWTGKAIDVTGAGARMLGFDPFTFPTGAYGTATPLARGGRVQRFGGGGLVGRALRGGGGRARGLHKIGQIEHNIDYLNSQFGYLQRRFDLSDEEWVIEGDENTPPSINERVLRKHTDEQQTLLNVREAILKTTRQLQRLVNQTLHQYRVVRARVQDAIHTVLGRLGELRRSRGRQAARSREQYQHQLEKLRDALGPIDSTIGELGDKSDALPWEVKDAGLDVQELRREIRSLNPRAQLRDASGGWSPPEPIGGDDPGPIDPGPDPSPGTGADPAAAPASAEDIARAASDQLAAFTANRQALFSSFGSSMVQRAGAGFGDDGLAAAGMRAFGAFGSAGLQQGGGVTFNLTQHYAEPPQDPHSWTRGVQFEIESRMG